MYGFHHPYLLNHEIQESENQAFYKYHILKIILRGPTLSLIAAIFSFFFIPLVSPASIGTVIHRLYHSKELKYALGDQAVLVLYVSIDLSH